MGSTNINLPRQFTLTKKKPNKQIRKLYFLTCSLRPSLPIWSPQHQQDVESSPSVDLLSPPQFQVHQLHEVQEFDQGTFGKAKTDRMIEGGWREREKRRERTTWFCSASFCCLCISRISLAVSLLLISPKVSSKQFKIREKKRRRRRESRGG